MRATRHFFWLALLLAVASRCLAIPTLPRPNVHVVDGGIGSILYRCTLNAPTLYEFFAYDALGSTVALTISNGVVRESNLYEAFGGVVSTWGTSVNNRLSHTKERDFSLGLDNHGMRYYDPVIGRYITRDPLGYGDGLNNYLYVGNNPVNHIDPLGLSEENGLVNDVEEATIRPEPIRPVMQHPQTDEECIQRVMENRNRMGSPNAYTKALAKGAEIVGDTINSFDPVTPFQRLSSGKNADGTPLSFEQARDAGRRYMAAMAAVALLVEPFVPNEAFAGFASKGRALTGTAAKTAEQLEFGFVKNLENPNFVLYKASEFNPSMLRPGEYKLNLPKLGSTELNWAQNQAELSKAMSIGNPIREVNPFAERGFLQRERDFLGSGGWQRTQQGNDFFWVKPGGQ